MSNTKETENKTSDKKEKSAWEKAFETVADDNQLLSNLLKLLLSPLGLVIGASVVYYPFKKNKQVKTDLKKELLLLTQETKPTNEATYEWVKSKFNECIEDYNIESEDSISILHHENFNLINICLRCLLENIIRLNESILKLNHFLTVIIESFYNYELSNAYPFTGILISLSERLNTLSKTKQQHISLRYCFNLKAKLVCMPNRLKQIVALISFNEVENYLHNKKFSLNKNETSMKQNDKQQNWKERYKHYLQQDLIKSDIEDD